MFAFRDALDPTPAQGSRVEVAFTDASLDFSDDERMETTLERLGGVLDVDIAWARQVHGADVVTVESVDRTSQPPQADGLVTAEAGIALMVRVADCVPVVFADAASSIVGVAHAGRRGVELDVVTATVQRMREIGATDIQAWIGPHICGRCYEVPAAMRDEIASRVPVTFAETSWGTPALDLGAGVAAQLTAAGVAVTSIPGCTREDDRLHSYRRDGAESGRFAGLVWLEAR